MSAAEPRSPLLGPGSPKPYDCLLKFLLVGDSDVGKEELLNGMDNGSSESPYNNSNSGRFCGSTFRICPPLRRTFSVIKLLIFNSLKQ